MPSGSRSAVGPVNDKRLTELIEVNSMHERKMAMFQRADAFVALVRSAASRRPARVPSPALERYLSILGAAVRRR